MSSYIFNYLNLDFDKYHLRVCLIIVFENNCKKQFLRITFKSYCLMFCKIIVYLEI